MSREPGEPMARSRPASSRAKLVNHLCVMGLLASIAAVGAWGAQIPVPSQSVFEEGGFSAERERVEVTLYFATSDASQLAPEVRELVRDPAVSVPFQAMVALANGPASGSDLVATIPPDARVERVELSGDVATVDWSQSFVDEHWGGSAGEWLTIQSIVETMSQFAGIKRIQLLVEGKPIETLAGHFELDHPFPSDSAKSVSHAVDGVAEP